MIKVGMPQDIHEMFNFIKFLSYRIIHVFIICLILNNSVMHRSETTQIRLSMVKSIGSEPNIAEIAQIIFPTSGYPNSLKVSSDGMTY